MDYPKIKNKWKWKKNGEKYLEKELGPGKYKYKSDIGLGPKYTFGKKLKKFKNPGPGSYNIKTDIKQIYLMDLNILSD